MRTTVAAARSARIATEKKKKRSPEPEGEEGRFSWPHVASVAVLLAAAFVFALLADWSPTALSQTVLAVLSLALLLAAAAVSAPALLRRGLLGRWLRWRTRARFTAAGLPFLAALLILVVAAVNSGNNLIYIVVAALLGALVTSGVFSAFNLSGLALDPHWPERAFAGDPVPVQLSLTNEKRWLPSYSLTLTAASRGAGTGAAMRSAFFPYLGGGRAAGARSEVVFPRRGRYSAASFAVSSRFPFGLMDKRRRFETEGPGDLIVYPSVAGEAWPAALAATREARRSDPFPGLGEELHRLRPRAQGDSLRLVHWKASAKAGALRVREFSRERGGRARIWVAFAPDGAATERIERAIEICAATLWRLAQSETWIEFVGLNPVAEPAPEAACFFAPSRPAEQALHPALRYLALLAADRGPAPAPARVSEAGVTTIAFVARREDAPPIAPELIIAAEEL